MTDEEVDEYAAYLIIGSKSLFIDWDQIAESHPSGEILDDEDCNRVRELLDSARVTVSWE